MDLPVIGAHCALPSCNELDLLPIQCLCDNMYCRKHIFPESHDCTSLVTIDQDVQSRNKDRSGRCSFTKCNRQNLSSFGSTSNNIGNSAECTGCSFSFCAVCVSESSLGDLPLSSQLCYSHRFPSAHSCPGVADGQPSDRTDTARELLLKNFSASKTVPSVQKPRILTTKDPKKLAQIQKVELMKMRQKAQPGDPKTGSSSIPIPERHYILAKSDAENDSFRPFWFIKVCFLDACSQRAPLKHNIGRSQLAWGEHLICFRIVLGS